MKTEEQLIWESYLSKNKDILNEGSNEWPKLKKLLKKNGFKLTKQKTNHQGIWEKEGVGVTISDHNVRNAQTMFKVIMGEWRKTKANRDN